MNDKNFNIPKGIRYLSEWKEFGEIFPDSPIILNKKVCDCGASFYFLSDYCKENIILCSPRLNLIQTKIDDERLNIFWYKGNVSNTELLQYISQNSKHKIITTYDSFQNLKEQLHNLSDYRIIVDEMQCIIKDSAFKGMVEKNFLNSLYGLKKIVYLSATPTPDKYNSKVEILKDVPTYNLIWNNEDITNFCIKQVELSETARNSFSDVLREYIDKYNKNGFFNILVKDGKTYESKELCVYCNNVKMICRFLSNPEFNPENTIVICANDSKGKNKRELKKVGFSISKPIKNGEKHPTYTFITKCAFEGADFYSTNASSIIFSEPKIDCMAVDIFIDALQIVGRQRLKENVFRNNIIIYKKVDNESFESFEDMREKKLNSSKRWIQIVNDNIDMKENILSKFKTNDYSKDYLDINSNGDLDINEMRMIAEDYAEDIRKQKEINCSILQNVYNTKNETELNIFYKDFNSTKSFQNKMKLYCDEIDNFPDLKDEILYSIYFPKNYSLLYQHFGKERLKSFGYNYSFIMEKYKEEISNSLIKDELDKYLISGYCYSKKDIKQILIEIFNKFNIHTKPSAKDIQNYYNVEETQWRQNKTNIHGFKIIGEKAI